MPISPEALAASFRDPNGVVYQRDGVLYRQVNEGHRPDYEHLMRSGLYASLVDREWLIPHEEADLDLALSDGAAYVLRPERVAFISYPYEWAWSQLKAAALLTLSIQSEALLHGMTLRDATAFNVTFHRGAPIFLDTTSLGVNEEGQPWVAYRQFCQHFLAPLALMSHRDVRVAMLLRDYLDGIPLDLAATLLPARALSRPRLAMHIKLHAGSQRRHADDGTAPSGKRFSKRAFEGLIDSLRGAIESLPEPSGASVWRDYYGQADHYSDTAATRKEEIVGAWLEQVRPSSVWDLGANTGRFSQLATEKGLETIAFDGDPFCVDALYQSARQRGDTRLTSLVMDLTNPSPGLGWAHVERESLLARGPAGAILALALIHHLAIAAGIPLSMITEWFATLAPIAIIEWVPKHDAMVARLLRDREDIFTSYTEASFEEALGRHFDTLEKEAVGDSGRSLYLVKRR